MEAPGGGAPRLALVEPVYLFVDLEVAFQVMRGAGAGWGSGPRPGGRRGQATAQVWAPGCLWPGRSSSRLAARRRLRARHLPRPPAPAPQVSSVVITAGEAMRNASVFIGNDTGSVAAGNVLAAAGVDIPAKGTVAVPTGGTPPGRYVIVYTGMASEVGARARAALGARSRRRFCEPQPIRHHPHRPRLSTPTPHPPFSRPPAASRAP